MMAIKTKTNDPRQAIKMYSVMVNFSLSSSSDLESEKTKQTMGFAEDTKLTFRGNN